MPQSPELGNGLVKAETVYDREASVATIFITGELDASNHIMIEAITSKVVNDPDINMLIHDVYRTTYIDSFGVRHFFETARRMNEQAKEYRIQNSRGICLRVMELTGLAEVVEFIYTDGVSPKDAEPRD